MVGHAIQTQAMDICSFGFIDCIELSKHVLLFAAAEGAILRTWRPIGMRGCQQVQQSFALGLGGHLFCRYLFRVSTWSDSDQVGQLTKIPKLREFL